MWLRPNLLTQTKVFEAAESPRNPWFIDRVEPRTERRSLSIWVRCRLVRPYLTGVH